MATSKNKYHERHPSPGSIKSRDLHYALSEGPGYRLPADLLARICEKDMAPIIGGGHNYAWSLTNTPGWSLVTGGTADALAESTLGGVLMTLASDDNFDMTLDSKLAITPTSGRWYGLVCRMQVSAITGEGFRIGLTTGGSAAALPFGTDYTDQVTLSKAIASADVYGKVRGNSGTAADTAAALGTMVNDTEIEIAIAFYVHATSPQGYFWYNGTRTEFSTAQKAQLAAILTTPPTMYWTIHGTGATGTNPTISITTFMAGADN